jgi:hypothetical protein
MSIGTMSKTIELWCERGRFLNAKSQIILGHKKAQRGLESVDGFVKLISF